jgi:hypothetical protein
MVSEEAMSGRTARICRVFLIGAMSSIAAVGCAARQPADRKLPHQSGSVTVRAWVDGRDILTIDGDVLSWEHLDTETAAVGRYNGNRPTVVNGIQWFPDWGGATDYRSLVASKGTEIPYVPSIPRYRDTAVILHSSNGGRPSGAGVEVLPRSSSRAPVRVMFDNTGAEPRSKWVEATIVWQTIMPESRDHVTRAR